MLSLLGMSLALDFSVEEEIDDASNRDDELPLPTDTSDDLIGSLLDDDIAALDGSDLVVARDGDDNISGGAGNDIVFGGDGNDLIYGDADNDQIISGAGEDTIYGNDGDDILYGADILDESGYIDGLLSNTNVVANSDYQTEPGEADFLYGGAGQDHLFVGGNDVADGGPGADIINAGFWIKADEPAVIRGFEKGIDTLRFSYDSETPKPEVSFSENEENDALVEIDGEVAIILREVGIDDLSLSDVVLEPV
jgi:Ca2+-binding RTX toxin-like protein